MGDRGGYQRGTRVYVGGLSQGTKKEDLEMEFEKFGKLNNVWVAFNPPGFAFIEFSSKTDAENACESMNGMELMGGKLRVELSRSRGRGGFRGNEIGGRGWGGSRGGAGPPGMGFSTRGRGGSRIFGAPQGGGGPRRGGFGMGRDFNEARDDYSAGVGDGTGVYGGANGTFGLGHNNYVDGGDGASRYRSRSPISAGEGGNGGSVGLLPNRRY